MPPSRSGSLGRGLGDLMEGMPAALGAARAQSGTGFLRLSPEAIGLPPERAARAVSEALVQSVREHGVLQPILVRRRPEGYEVVAGARRLAAARLAGAAEIPAVVIQVSDEESEKLSAIENTCREPVAAPAAFPALPVEPSPTAAPPVPMAAPATVEPLGVVTPPPSSAVGTPPASVMVEHTAAIEVEKPRRWTSGRIGMAVVYGGAALVIGVMLGGRGMPQAAELRHPAGPELPVPPVTTVVTQMVETVRTVEVRPPVRGVDAAEIAALGWDGLRVDALSNGVIRVVVGRPLFRTRALLAGEDALQALGSIFRRHPNEWRVTVVGHTDAVPFVGTGGCRDNRELGLARATEVVRFLMREVEVPAVMLQAATAGEKDPPFAGDDAAARLKNRTATFRISRAP